MINKKNISIIIPVYNEQENIPAVYSQVTSIMQSLAALYDYEFIFINDGSKDASWQLLMQLAKGDDKVRALNFSRNFGHQAALTAGYAHAHGDAVVTMDADLQDPPSLLVELLNQWEKGADIVYARRIERKDSFLKRWSAFIYYKLLDTVADVRIPRNVGDFRLLDSQVVQRINHMPEHARYLRGLVAWTGFTQAFVDFKRPDRMAGNTGYTWQKMFKLALDGLTGFSTFPLKLALYFGLFLIAASASFFSYLCITSILGTAHSFIAWGIGAILFCMGIQSFCLWMLGEYIGRMYEQQKGRPLFIVAQEIGIVRQNEAILGLSRDELRGQKELQ